MSPLTTIQQSSLSSSYFSGMWQCIAAVTDKSYKIFLETKSEMVSYNSSSDISVSFQNISITLVNVSQVTFKHKQGKDVLF